MLNWLIRYAPAIAALEASGPLGSVLDVGCGTHGLACVRPQQSFVGLEIAYHGEPASTMVPFIADGGRLPWRDASFDTVLCLDVLEHVPRSGRPQLIAELARVAARQVLVACPSSRAQPADDLLRERLTSGGAAMPSWLQEHYECGLPTPAEVEDLVRGVEGFAAEPVPMVNGPLGTMVVMAEMDPAHALDTAAEYRERASEWADLLARSCFGESLRVAWRMERLAPRAALVGTQDLEADAVRAMRLPGARLADASGTAPAGDLDTEAPLTLWLAPRWETGLDWRDPLLAYLAHGPADGSTCLCLDVSRRPGAAEEIASACLAECGDRPFADVLLVEDRKRPRYAVAVESAADVRAALAVADDSRDSG